MQIIVDPIKSQVYHTKWEFKEKHTHRTLTLFTFMLPRLNFDYCPVSNLQYLYKEGLNLRRYFHFGPILKKNVQNPYHKLFQFRLKSRG